MSGKVTRSLAERFWEKVDVRGPDECWPWIGSCGENGTGYGQLYQNGKLRQAHKVAWELKYKTKFPQNRNACHSCNIKRCVNWKHIYPDTQRGNLAYARSLGRWVSPMTKRTHCPRGHEYTVENTYLDPRNWRQCHLCRCLVSKRRKTCLTKQK